MGKMRKKDLGKGIRALLDNVETPDPDNKESLIKELSNTVAYIPVSSVELNPFQPRTEFDEESLEELAKSISIHGLVQPITVRHIGGGKYQIISGERRIRACKIAGIDEVPAYVRIADDSAMLEMALIENIQRKDLNPIEIGISYQRLMDEFKLTHEQLAVRVVKKRSTITNYVRLLKLPPVIQQALKQDKISMGHARSLAGIDEIALQLNLLDQCIRKNWSVRQLEHTIQNIRSQSSGKKHDEPSAVIMQLQDELSAAFGTKVALKSRNNGSGQIMISYKSVEELQQILNLIRSI
jgi:ParB family chromosome partitioning protein